MSSDGTAMTSHVDVSTRIPAMTGGATDLGNPWMQYAGPPTKDLRLNPYESVSYTNFIAPDTKVNQVVMLKEATDMIITQDTDRPENTLMLPMAYTDELHFAWNTWKFNTVLVGQVPHEGIPRLITSRRKEYSDHVVRRGLAFVMEADYFNTRRGQTQLQSNIRGIQACVQVTMQMDAMYAIMSCKTYDQLYHQRFSTPNINYEMVIRDEIDNYCSIVKDETRLDITIEQHKRVLARQQKSPDLIMLPAGSSIYLSMAQPARTQYYTWGPDGVRNVKEGPRAITNLRGLAVFESKEFVESRSEPPINLLMRRKQIGERYEMRWRDRHVSLSDWPHPYESRARDIYIENQNRDDFDKVSMRDALRYAGIFSLDNDEYLATLRQFTQHHARTRHASQKALAAGHRALPPHPLTAFCDGADPSTLKLMDYFGEFDRANLEVSDLYQVAQTLLPERQVQGYVMQGLDTMISLVKEMENQPFNLDFFNAVIADVNVERAADNAPNMYNTANTHGCLPLPDEKHGCAVPPGYLSWPGLLTLADEANKDDSPWADKGKEAARAVEAFRICVTHLKNCMPSSAVFSAPVRDHWFSRAAIDDCHRVFHELFYVRRMPLWKIESGGGGGGASAGVVAAGAFFREISGMETEEDVMGYLAEILNVDDHERRNNGGFILAANLTKMALTDLLSILKMRDTDIGPLYEFLAKILVLGGSKDYRIVGYFLSGFAAKQEAFTREMGVKLSSETRDNPLESILRAGTAKLKKDTRIFPEEVRRLSGDGGGGGGDDSGRLPLSVTRKMFESMCRSRDVYEAGWTFANPAEAFNEPAPRVAPDGEAYGFLIDTPLLVPWDVVTYNIVGRGGGRSMANMSMTASDLAASLGGDFGGVDAGRPSSKRMRAAAALVGSASMPYAVGEDADAEGSGVMGLFATQKSRSASMAPPRWQREMAAASGSSRGDDDDDGSHSAIAAANINYWLNETRNFRGNGTMSVMHRVAAGVWLLSPCNTLTSWTQLIDNNIHVPLNFCLWRLWIEHNISAAVMMVSGYETGMTVYGGSNMAPGSDVVSKLLYYNYTYNAKAIVREPDNITFIEHFRPEGYCGGNNTRFINPEMYDERTAYEILNRNRPSIISTVLPITHRELPQHMTFTGRITWDEAHEQLDDGPHYSTASYYTTLYRELVENSAAATRPSEDTFLQRANRINISAEQGHQFSYNPVSRFYDKVTSCKGHKGANGCGRGSAAVWEGQTKFLPVQDWAQYRLT